MTLFVDASFCHQTQAAGWGSWAKRNDWQSGALLGGSFKAAIGSPHEAELCAIANALAVLKGRQDMDGLRAVMIQSDCLRALSLMLTMIGGVRPERKKEGGSDVFRLQKPKFSEQETLALSIIRKETAGLAVSVRHVKGHKGGEGRSWVNRQCDRIAREHMRASRIGKEVAA